MATVGTRAIAYIDSPHAPDGLAGSSWTTATMDLRTAEQFRVPFRAAQASDVSAGPECEWYESTDGGTSFESVAFIPYAITRASDDDSRKVFRVEGGLYAVAMCSGGPNTATLGLETAQVHSAYEAN